MKRILVNKTTEKVGEQVKISGWASTVRDHGGLIFVDLRDWSGIVQVIVNQENKEAFEIAEKIGTEYVIEIIGTVQEREESLKNPNLETGNIEIVTEEISILNECKKITIPIRH